MNEQDIIKKLKELKGIRPQKDWKEDTRSFLVSEIRNSVVEAPEKDLIRDILSIPKSIFSKATEQAWAVAAIIIIIAGGAFTTQAATKNARPGDSLYLARVFSEKAKVAITFNKEEKAKLDMQLASNRAKEITDVLAELDTDENEDSKKKAEKLSESFRDEIKIVKKNFEEIKQIREEANKSEENVEGGQKEEASFGIGDSRPEIVVTESSKEDEGMDIYEEDEDLEAGGEENDAEETAGDANGEAEVDAEVSLEVEASSTPETSDNNKDNVDDILSNAEISLDAKDFASAKEMLEAVDEMIDSGEVKGVNASSTPEEIKVDNVADISSTSSDQQVE
ncbi:hypothetical protein GF382_02395 [Candidatus Falkowbacteria bacterium]|nr:hypothetical protein [Candidatus Falkowbacteria bacterium]